MIDFVFFDPQFIVDVVAVLVIVAIANYWLLIPAAVMVVLLYLCRAMYIGASRSLKRIESLSKFQIFLRIPTN